MKSYYSHINQKNKDETPIKFIEWHLEGIQRIIEKSIYKNDFTKSIQEVIPHIVSLHDIGKWTDYFQDYLKTQRKTPPLSFHSLIGASTAFLFIKDNFDKKLATIAYYVIYNHHSPSLCNFTDCYDEENNKHRQQIREQPKHLIKAKKHIESTIGINIINYLPKEVLDLYCETCDIAEEMDIKNYFLVNYAFSLLIEADKLDASNTSMYTRIPIPDDIVDRHIEWIVKSKNIDVNTKQNKLRNQVRATVTKHLNSKGILDKKLFVLTAPTGIGKTLTALDFALRLREKIKVKENRNAQIICALPFINIIEQTFETYKEVLPDKVKLLAHYQYADVFEKDKKRKTDQEKQDDYKKRIMQLDTWQSDVVITSFVQLLQTLIGYRNKVLKKFHHLAGAIIIMDEVQNIQLEYAPLVGSVLHYLTKFLDARIIMMTATAPRILELANEEILNPRGENVTPFSLLPNAKSIFNQFERTELIPINIKNVINAEQFIQVFKTKWKKEESKSCLIVCNTVNRSIEIFDIINKYIKESNLEYQHPVEYLSTNLIPFHRLHVIDKIKEIFNQNKKNKTNIKPILISTQCVEAGVDLDFDMGFRDIAPIDSIVQVAGRVNRNDSEDKENSPVYIVNFGDCHKVYGKEAPAQIINALETEEKSIPEKLYYDLVKKYFEGKLGAYETSKKIFKAMEELHYTSDNDDDTTVSSFKVIHPRNNLKSVFIETDERISLKENKAAKEVVETFKDMLIGKIKKDEFNKDYKKSFHQRIVSIPDYYLNDLQGDYFRLTDEILIVPNDFLEMYDIQTGFVRKKSESEKSVSLCL